MICKTDRQHRRGFIALVVLIGIAIVAVLYFMQVSSFFSVSVPPGSKGGNYRKPWHDEHRLLGPDEIIEDGKTGILTPVGDPRAIGEAIISILSDPQKREEMGKAARERARRLFDKNVIIPQWEELFKKVARGDTSAHGKSQ